MKNLEFNPDRNKALARHIKVLKSEYTPEQIVNLLKLMRDKKLKLPEITTYSQATLGVLDSCYKLDEVPELYFNGILEYVRND